MERFPSGQREQTVNLLSVTSVVRIHPSPPRKSVLFGTDFLLQDNLLPFSSIFVALPRRKSLLSVSYTDKNSCHNSADCLLAIQADMCFFSCSKGVDYGCFLRKQPHALRAEPPFGADRKQRKMQALAFADFARSGHRRRLHALRAILQSKRLCKQSNRRRRRLSSLL